MTNLQQKIQYFGQQNWVKCDLKCSKAWGLHSRPKDHGGEFYLSDDELGTAPVDPETYEGSDGKPSSGVVHHLNRWCVRECERSVMWPHDNRTEPTPLKDFSKRVEVGR